MSDLPPAPEGIRTFTVTFVRRDALSDTSGKGRLQFELLIEAADEIKRRLHEGKTWLSFRDREDVLHNYRAEELRYVWVKEHR